MACVLALETARGFLRICHNLGQNCMVAASFVPEQPHTHQMPGFGLTLGNKLLLSSTRSVIDGFFQSSLLVLLQKSVKVPRGK